MSKKMYEIIKCCFVYFLTYESLTKKFKAFTGQSACSELFKNVVYSRQKQYITKGTFFEILLLSL